MKRIGNILARVMPAIIVGLFVWPRGGFRLLVLIALAGMITSGFAADDRRPAAAGVGEKAVVEQCLEEEIPWLACWASNKERLTNIDPVPARACVLSGAPMDYCFPTLSMPNQEPEPPGLWFFIRPRSLWTASPYDLLSGSGVALR